MKSTPDGRNRHPKRVWCRHRERLRRISSRSLRFVRKHRVCRNVRLAIFAFLEDFWRRLLEDSWKTLGGGVSLEVPVSPSSLTDVDAEICYCAIHGYKGCDSLIQVGQLSATYMFAYVCDEEVERQPLFLKLLLNCPCSADYAMSLRCCCAKHHGSTSREFDLRRSSLN